MGAVLGVLKAILCAVQAFSNSVLWACMSAVKLVLAGIAGLWTVAISALPDMPTPPSWSFLDSRVIGIVAWMFPLGALVTTISLLLTLYVAWQGVAALLRWGKFV